MLNLLLACQSGLKIRALVKALFRTFEHDRGLTLGMLEIESRQSFEAEVDNEIEVEASTRILKDKPMGNSRQRD